MNVTIKDQLMYVGDTDGCVAVVSMTVFDRLVSITTDADAIRVTNTDGVVAIVRLKSEQQARAALAPMGAALMQWRSERGGTSTARAVRFNCETALAAGALTFTTLPGMGADYDGVTTPNWTAVGADMKPLTIIREPMSLPVYSREDTTWVITRHYCGDLRDILEDADCDQEHVEFDLPVVTIPFAMWCVTRSNGKLLIICGPYSAEMELDGRPADIWAAASILAYFENLPLTEEHARYCLQASDFPLVGVFDDVESATYLGRMKLAIVSDLCTPSTCTEE